MTEAVPAKTARPLATYAPQKFDEEVSSQAVACQSSSRHIWNRGVRVTILLVKIIARTRLVVLGCAYEALRANSVEMERAK